MLIIIPAIFILLILIWFLVMAIIDKNKKLITIMGIITLAYVLFFGGFAFFAYMIVNQFIK